MRRRTLINKKRREIVKERFDEFFFSVGYEWKSHDGFYFYYKRGEGKTDICVLGFAYSGAVEIKVSERLVTLDEVEQYVEKMYPDYKSYSDARTFYLDDLYWPTVRDTSLGNKDFLDWGIKTRFSTLNAIDLFCENYFTYYFETAQEVIENYSNFCYAWKSTETRCLAAKYVRFVENKPICANSLSPAYVVTQILQNYWKYMRKSAAV